MGINNSTARVHAEPSKQEAHDKFRVLLREMSERDSAVAMVERRGHPDIVTGFVNKKEHVVARSRQS
jgi:hypothetical protein